MKTSYFFLSEMAIKTAINMANAPSPIKKKNIPCSPGYRLILKSL